MRGRGLLIAAAVLQLVGAALFFMSGVLQIALAMSEGHGREVETFFAIGLVGVAVAIGYVVVSIKLIGLRRWAWITSLALDGLSALSFLSLPILGHVGFGELMILAALFGVPLFVTIGLLIGGRHAVSPTAAASPAAIQSCG